MSDTNAKGSNGKTSIDSVFVDTLQFIHETVGSVEVSNAGVNRLDPLEEEIAASSRELAFFYEDQVERAVTTGLNKANMTDAAAGAGVITSLLTRALPSERRQQTKRAFLHYETDDLLQNLVNILLDFSTLGLSLQATPPMKGESSEETSTTFQATLEDLVLSLDIHKLVEDMIRDWLISDSIILYWRIDNSVNQEGVSSENSIPVENKFGIPGLQELSTLNAGDVDWDNSLGGDLLYIEMSPVLRNRIEAAFKDGRKKKRSVADTTRGLIEEGIGMKWIQAVRNGESMVELKAEDGDHWIIRTKARKNRGLAYPSMKAVFLDLEQRGLLKSGEFSAAFMMKHFILLIKAGESIESGPMAGQKTNWMSKKEAKQLLQYFSVIGRAMRAAVNHTIKLEFVFPPKEMFDKTKFESSEERIFNWSGMARVMASGQGSDYGGGYLSIRRTIAKLEKARLQINLMLQSFFLHETIVVPIGTPPGYFVTTNFDVNVLKEPRQLLEEVRFLFESSISDARTSAFELGRDPSRLKASKAQTRKEDEDDKAWTGVGMQGQQFGFGGGGVEGGPEGRPAGDGVERNEFTRTRSPGGRVTENT